MKELLKKAFEAGRDYEYAEQFQRPGSKPNFNEWYEANNQVYPDLEKFHDLENPKCYNFEGNINSSSATKCKNCGRELFEHQP